MRLTITFINVIFYNLIFEIIEVEPYLRFSFLPNPYGYPLGELQNSYLGSKSNVIKDNLRTNSKPTYFNEDYFKNIDQQAEILDEIEVPSSEVLTRGGLRNGVLICQDENSNCGSWAKLGQCATNPGYMLSNCKESCGNCEAGGSKKGTYNYLLYVLCQKISPVIM